MSKQMKMLQQAMDDFGMLNAEIITLRKKSDNWWEAEIIFDGRKMLFGYNALSPIPAWCFIHEL